MEQEQDHEGQDRRSLNCEEAETDPGERAMTREEEERGIRRNQIHEPVAKEK